ncbi:pilus (MSHA type) biogenesis protein MshL [Pseudoduganella umbonata]|uniref:General secretion pathway protein D n=1 Tax=Pseudoduganella umbonata TaxID=864828 RepID=A0A4P8HMU0_9BURK|nr:pilus (MSHA type) biogenesis protein MshL [Pseudoduganella umbonata]MBB3219651.1 general secretion pathway protein D [Pseudoduganella umbonata]QCP09712.1 pilus (MSHA type) biogenesis protein MshL [Pseudoduganella umbonata]
MKKVAATLLCSLLGACAAPRLPVSPAHVTEAPRPAGAIPDPVQQSAVLPPPQAAARAETFSVTVHRAPVESVLFALARDAGMNVDVHPAITGVVTLNALDQTLQQLLDRISRQVDMRYEIDGGTLLVLPDEPHWRNYRIDYVNIARTTNSSVSIATQISTTGGGGAGTSYTGSNTGGGTVPNAGTSLSPSNNNSTTTVSNRADNNFWYNLEKNIRDMLRPTNLNDPLTDPLAQLREQTGMQAQQATQGTGQPGAQGQQPGQPGQPGQPQGGQFGTGQPGTYQPAFSPAGGATQPADASYPGVQAATAQGRAAQRNAPSVIVNPEGGIVTVRASSRQHDKVREFIDTLQSAAKRQVMIEATILEVRLSDQYQQGINWQRIASGGAVFGQGNPSLEVGPLTGAQVNQGGMFSLTYFNPMSAIGNIKTAIQLLESYGKVHVLSSPKLSVLNNQTALLKVVDNSIFFTLKVTPAVTNSSGGVSAPATYESRVETVPVGFVMSVTPQISADGEVTLNVRPTITRVVGEVLDPNPELKRLAVQSTVPVIQARELESVMRLHSGQTAVMGGLMQDSVDNSRNGLPLLSRVPLLGNLLSYRDDNVSKTELVIFLRAVVVHDASMDGDYRDLRYLLPGSEPLNKNPYGPTAGQTAPAGSP